MGRVAGVSDGPLCFPHTPPGVNVLEGQNNLGCCKSINQYIILFITVELDLPLIPVECCWRYGPKESLHHYRAVTSEGQSWPNG